MATSVDLTESTIEPGLSARMQKRVGNSLILFIDLCFSGQIESLNRTVQALNRTFHCSRLTGKPTSLTSIARYKFDFELTKSSND